MKRILLPWEKELWDRLIWEDPKLKPLPEDGSEIDQSEISWASLADVEFEEEKDEVSDKVKLILETLKTKNKDELMTMLEECNEKIDWDWTDDEKWDAEEWKAWIIEELNK